ncbi:helix-turn-helix domain-containing protein [Azohydromonas lata]|uniref:DNA-binding protein n=1 Tax=Azohydromonas lata TaxID=45677 RepID=A0ABU5I884_9BURK|nr:DNA-binding protein [Azohydromonas lata]MDZ5455311.1 DNA-binding protein [Azohydromonas lata]
MNQSSIIVKLRDFTSSARPFGNIEGKEVFRKLVSFVEEHPRTQVFGISLDGIKATDASFPRESVVSLAKHYRGERGVFLSDIHDRDLIDNWMYAARAKEQPLVIWNDDVFEVIGPELNPAARSLVEYVLEKRAVLASQVAADLGLSVQNASTRLKNLVAAGYFLRAEEAAESGGIEFKYRAIH